MEPFVKPSKEPLVGEFLVEPSTGSIVTAVSLMW